MYSQTRIKKIMSELSLLKVTVDSEHNISQLELQELETKNKELENKIIELQKKIEKLEVRISELGKGY